MSEIEDSVAQRRDYRVQNVAEAKAISRAWLESVDLSKAISLGLPEVDDRYHVWRIPLKRIRGDRVGEIVVDAYTTEVIAEKTTRPVVIEARLLNKDETVLEKRTDRAKTSARSPLRNTIGQGDCRVLIDEMPAESVDLVFTSPPTSTPGRNTANTRRTKATSTSCVKSSERLIACWPTDVSS